MAARVGIRAARVHDDDPRLTALQIEVDVGGIGLARELRKEMPLGRRGLGGGMLEDERVGGSRAHGSAPEGVIAMSPADPGRVKCAVGDINAWRAWVENVPHR